MEFLACGSRVIFGVPEASSVCTAIRICSVGEEVCCFAADSIAQPTEGRIFLRKGLIDSKSLQCYNQKNTQKTFFAGGRKKCTKKFLQIR